MTKPNVYAAIDICRGGYELTVMVDDDSGKISIEVEAEFHSLGTVYLSDLLGKIAAYGEVCSVSLDRWQGQLCRDVEAAGFKVIEAPPRARHRQMVDRVAYACRAGVFKDGRIYFTDMFFDDKGRRREKNATILWAFNAFHKSREPVIKFVGEL